MATGARDEQGTSLDRAAWAAAAALLLTGATRSGPHAPDTRSGAILDDEIPRFPGEDELRREGDGLDADRPAAARRVAVKCAVVGAWARGDLTLAEAADRFRDISAGDPAARAARRRHPGATDAELWLRNVAAFARVALAPRRGLGPGPLARLEAELAATCPAGNH